MRTKTINFREFMGTSYSLAPLPMLRLSPVNTTPSLEGFFNMSPMVKWSYIGIIGMGVVFIIGSYYSNYLAKNEADEDSQRLAKKIDLFMKVTLGIGSVGMLIWFIVRNPLL